MRPADPEPSEPLGGVGFLLDRLAHSLSRDFADVLAPLGLGGTQLGVLSTLRRYGALNQSRLAAYLGIERQQMVNLVNQLEERGLVERRSHDRRSWSIRLTDEGARLQEEAVATGRRHEERVFAVLSGEEREALAELLLRLVPQGRFRDLFHRPRAPRTPGRERIRQSPG